jgi:4-alpha-glucanotransferase
VKGVFVGYEELIGELSNLCGILPEYWDISGNKRIASLETRKAILRAMGLKIDSEKDVVEEINRRKWRPWKNFIEPVHVISVNNQPFSIPVHIPIKKQEETGLIISWSLEDERGRRDKFTLAPEALSGAAEQWIDETRYITVMLPDSVKRDTGYYILGVECKHPDRVFPRGRAKLHKKSKIIIAPDTCYIPPALQTGRAWGLSVNLYALRSERNWGIGDFSDLGKIVKWTADMKGSFVGVSPLHAIPNTKPFGVSPYSPISRLYKNFIYLDPEKVPDVMECEDERKLIGSKKFRKELDQLRRTALVEYEKIALMKEKVLRTAFEFFYRKHFSRSTSRGRDFKTYVRDEGICLESFSLFMALWEHFKETKGVYTWREWPESYHRAAGKATRSFRRTHSKAILFHQYVQWLIDRQLREIAEGAGNLGMKIGIYYDLAIGSVGCGSDAWNYKDVISGGADAGAPPDDFSPEGQKWGFPPMIPEKLRETGYELFIETIRKNMKYGGAIRIDHALGLFRLFWVPHGMRPEGGAYVNYPSEDLLRIIALESVRNRCTVIGEDLGTVGDNVREGLKRFQMLSYRLFYFERNYPNPSFLLPERYPETALCAVTTHDLPTLYGYWIGRDIQMRRKLGLFPDDSTWRKQAGDRERDKGLILNALKSQNKVPDEYPSDPRLVRKMTPELCLAIYSYLARTPCRLLLVSTDDIIGTINQQNIPGTVGSYPNWMQKTQVTIGKMLKDGRFRDLSGMLSKHFGVNAGSRKN